MPRIANHWPTNHNPTQLQAIQVLYNQDLGCEIVAGESLDLQQSAQKHISSHNRDLR